MSTFDRNTHLDTAFELLSHAINAEDNADYTKAYANYMAALDYLMAAQQSETNEKSRALLKAKADEYLNRAETIRERIDVDRVHNLKAIVGSSCDGEPTTSTSTAQSVILDEAFKCAKQAMDADASQNYAEAYKLYMKSMDHFMFAQRYDLNEQSRTLIRSEVAEYLSRAETIKKHLDALKDSEARGTPANSASNLSRDRPRPPEAVFLHTAIEIVQRAIQQDGKNNYRSAYELYNGAFDYFMLAHKYEKDEQSKIAIRASMEEYLARAEVIKKFIR